MNKVIKTILIISIAVFGGSLLLISPVHAQDGLDVEFQIEPPLPLFDQANFLPGDSVTRWVKVTNNSGTTQRIATEAINYTKPIPADDLSRVLIIVIKQGGTDLYGGSSPTGPKSLYDFYQDSEAYPEIYLSDLGNGEMVQYDFTISFPSEKENEWQEKTTHFDILIGFQGTASSPPPSPPTPPGGGGGLPPGLTIFNEASWNVTANSVTIIWTTSYFSTSQVIYGAAGEAHTLNLSDNTGIPPKYGYAHTTPEYNTSPKVTGHSVTIYGLNPGTTYYYRTVSHASLAISREYSFTTLGVKVEEKVEEGIEGEISFEEETLQEEVVLAPTGEEEIEKPEEFITEGAVSPEEGIVTVPSEERVPGGGLAPLLLASLGVIRETDWMAIVVTICLLGLVVIGIREWELVQKKKKNIS